MLLPDNIHPELCIYYNASLVLQELQKEDKQKMFCLYEKLKKKNGMSFGIFSLCLDWLYIVDAAEMDEEGCVVLCT